MMVPGETTIIIAGFLSIQGYLKIENCMIVIFLGAILGDSIGYTLGRIIGRGYFDRHERFLFIKLKHIQKAESYFHLHGGKTIFLGKFIGFLRSFGPFVAGMSGVRYRAFLKYNIISCIIWTISFSLLGYFFGLSWNAIERWSGRAGLFIFIILLVMVGFGSIYRLLVKKQHEFRAWFHIRYDNLINSVRILKFKEKHPKLTDFVKKSLSPWSYLSIHLAAGFVISAILIWIFGEIMGSIMPEKPLNIIDQWVLERALYFRTPSLNAIMVGVTQLGSLAVIVILSLPISMLLFLRRKFDALICYLTSVIGGAFLNYILKAAIQRDRPITDETLVHVTSFSFPSGHAMLSTILYGMIGYYLIRYINSWRLRSFVALSMVFIILLIGFTRIYLQVHYLSDIIAGYVGGGLWLVICITGLEIYRKRRSNEFRRIKE